MGAIDVKELPFPPVSRQGGQSNVCALEITGDGFTIGVLYGHECEVPGGPQVVHCSISKSCDGFIQSITHRDIDTVADVCRKRGMKWPEKFSTTFFKEGPFKDRGLHIWERVETN